MTKQQRPIVRIGGFSGIAAPIVAFTAILLAISLSPWFDWQQNALSDLGVAGTPAILFNLGLVFAGGFEVLFAAGLWVSFKGEQLSQIGASILAVDGVFLSSVGVFPEPAGILHFYVSVGFFVLLLTSILMLGVTTLLRRMRIVYGILSVSSAIFSAMFWLIPHNGVAIPEAATALVASAWSIFSGIRMTRL